LTRRFPVLGLQMGTAVRAGLCASGDRAAGPHGTPSMPEPAAKPVTPRTNRRSTPRRKAKVKVKVRCFRGIMEAGPNLAVKILDVSQTGVRLILNAALEREKDVVVILEGPLQLRPFRVTGRVTWSVPAEDGTHCTGIRLDRYFTYQDLQYLS
jgi:hypothetical protein